MGLGLALLAGFTLCQPAEVDTQLQEREKPLRGLFHPCSTQFRENTNAGVERGTR